MLAQNLVRQKVKNLSCEFFLNYYMGLKEFEKIDKVIDEVVLYYSINKKSLFLEHRGQQHVSEARQVISYILRIKLYLSFPAIGKILNRDHTTIMHACKKVEELILNRPELDDFVSNLLSGTQIDTRVFNPVPVVKKIEKKGKVFCVSKEQLSKLKSDDKTRLLFSKLAAVKEDYSLPIEFSEEYLSKILNDSNRRFSACLINRYGFGENKFTTLQQLANQEKLTRERIRQIVAAGIYKIVNNNKGGTLQILTKVIQRLEKDKIIYVDDFLKEIFVFEKKKKEKAKKFLKVIMNFTYWVKEFELSGKCFFVFDFNEKYIIKEIGNIKGLILQIASSMPDTVTDRWLYIYSRLLISEYLNTKPYLLNKIFLKSCYNNYLFESEVMIHKYNDYKKYSIKTEKKHIKGVPKDYLTYFN